MKLTQKTLFQCFDKSRSQSSPSVSLSQSQPEILPQLRECSIPQTDFLLPVHVRQSNLPLLSSNDSIPSFKTRNINEENSFSSNNKEFYRICPTRIDPPENLPKLQFVPITSTDRQMELLEEYTADQSMINWKSIFEGLQDYRKKAIEQNQYEQLLWTDLYRPKTSKTYLGNHTYQVKRLKEWFSFWTKRLQNEQPKQILSKKRKHFDDEEEEDLSDNSNLLIDSSNYQPKSMEFVFR